MSGTDRHTIEAPKARGSSIDSVAVAFVAGLHVLAVFGVLHLIFAFSWWTVLAGGLMYLACGLSITAGYHRLFAHRSYQATWPVRLLLLIFGAASFQRSALLWSAEHRIHHRYSDEEQDPYSVVHGFWWAHVGWVVSKAGPYEFPKDLEADPLMRFQHRFWLPLALGFGLAFPALLGLLWGDPLGAFLVAGALRIVMTWHATWSVNSFAHTFGSRPYSKTQSARDNFWVALLTLGEGYHNFHHRFQRDYRNGVRWYQYDPTKWLLSILNRVGLVRDLVRIPRASIMQARANQR